MASRKDSKLEQMGIIDRYYPASPPGVVRCFQFLIGICNLIAIESTGNCWYSFHTRFRFIVFVTISSILIPLLIYLLYLYRVNNWLSKYMNMSLTLLTNDIVISFLFFLSSVLSFTAQCPRLGLDAATKLSGVFGLMGTIGFISTGYMEHAWYKQSQSVSNETTNPET